MTRNLWRAEWLKTRRSPTNKLLYRALLILVSVAYTIMTIITAFNRDEMLDGARTNLPFPYLTVNLNMLYMELGPIMAMIFIAASVGHEYTRDTWKMVLPRYGSRVAFLITKLASGVLAMVITLLSLLVVGTLVGVLCSLVLGIGPVNTQQLTGHLLTQQLTVAGVGMLASLFYGLLTLILTVLSRSTIAGVGGGFVLMIMGEPLGAGLGLLSKTLARLWPLPHITNLKAEWIDAMDMQKMQVDYVFRGPMSTTQSLLTLLAYMAIFVAGSFYLFRKRDMAG